MTDGMLSQRPVFFSTCPANQVELMRWMPPPDGIECAITVS